jgi:hypothetical protein
LMQREASISGIQDHKDCGCEIPQRNRVHGELILMKGPRRSNLAYPTMAYAHEGLASLW